MVILNKFSRERMVESHMGHMWVPISLRGNCLATRAEGAVEDLPFMCRPKAHLFSHDMYDIHGGCSIHHAKACTGNGDELLG
jgi:hypothetical protein